MGLFRRFQKGRVTMSSGSLEWQITRNCSSYLVKNKRTGVQFTKDPLSVTKKHGHRDAGSLNTKAVTVRASADGKSIELVSKHLKVAGKNPDTRVVKLKTNVGSRRMIAAIRRFMVGQYFRPDLCDAAVRRACVLYTAQQRANVEL